MTTFATVNSDANALVQYVQSADASDLQARVNAVFLALSLIPTARVTAVTLSGAGDGHTFIVEIVAAAQINIVGGAGIPPGTLVAHCYAAADAPQLVVQRIALGVTGQPLGDEQMAGSSKGTRFMGLYLTGPFFSGLGAGAGAIMLFGSPTAAFTIPNVAIFPLFTLVTDPGFVAGVDNTGFSLPVNGVMTYQGGARRFSMSAQMSGSLEDPLLGATTYLSVVVNGQPAHGPAGFGIDTWETDIDHVSARAYRKLAFGDTVQLAVASSGGTGGQALTINQAALLVG